MTAIAAFRLAGLVLTGWLVLPATAPAQTVQACPAAAPAARVDGKVFTGGCATPWNRPGMGVAKFLGIQYATADRWTAPVLAAPQGGSVTAFGPACPQPGVPGTAEQCLYLNVYTPADAVGAAAAKLPVILFIHGGSFVSGTGGVSMFDGSALAAQGPAVVVTINYRLGALGFLADSPLGLAGNYGLQDQQAAIAWVHEHIKAFGGDPSAVTLVGQSAGAMSVGLHLFSVGENAFVEPPVDSRALFRAGIMESNPMSTAYPNMAEATDAARAFISQVCSSLGGSAPADCTGSQAALRSLPPSAFVDQENAFMSSYTPKRTAPQGRPTAMMLAFSPTMDGMLVRNQPDNGYASEQAARNARPYVFGTNRNDGSLFAAITNDGYVSQSSTYTVQDYLVGLKADYGRWAGVIDKYAAYQPLRQKTTSYWTQSAAALGNAITDHGFSCANLVAADKTLAQMARLKRSGAVSAVPPVYAYSFTQPPYFDLYPSFAVSGQPMGACNPDNAGAPDICHGNELPYVFGTLATVTPPLALQPPKPSDFRLQSRMVAAWAAFAADPFHPGPEFGRPYTRGAKVAQFNGATRAPVDLAEASNCGMWRKVLNATP